MQPWNAPPPFGTSLNQALGAHAVYLPASGEDILLTATGGGGSLSYTDGMLRRSLAANTAGRYRTAHEHERTPSAALLWVGNFLTTPTQYASLGGLTYANTNTTPFSAIEIKRRGAGGSNNVFLSHSAGGAAGTLEIAAASFTLTSGPVVIVGSVAPGSQIVGARAVNTNVQAFARATTASALAYGTGPRFAVGDIYNVRNPQADCEMMVLFNRALSDAECLMLLANPYAVFAPRMYAPTLGPPAAVGGGFLAAWASQRSRVIGVGLH